MRALEVYAFRRGEGILLSKGQYPANSDMEIIGFAGIEDMQKSYDLLESVTSPDFTGNRLESMCTIAMPVAIMSEDIDAVVAAIEKIARSHEGEEMPLDVILWANAKYSDDNKTDVERAASSRYAELVEKLRSVTSQQLNIESALQLTPEADFSMSKLRANYMDAAALGSFDKGYGFNHPVMWIDADMTNIAHGTIKELSKPIRDIEALVTHANLQFTADWASGQSFSDLDDGTRAVIFHEAQRRQLNWIQSTEDSMEYSPGSYPEECGLAFSIGAYLICGGVDTKVPLSESGYLIRNIRKRFIHDFPEPILALSDKRNGHLPSRDVEYRKTARMGVSARRHYEVVQQSGVTALPTADSSGYDTLFTDMDKARESRHISRSEMVKLYEENNGTWLNRLPYKKSEESREPIILNRSEVQRRQDRNAKIAYRLINRYFKD